MNFKHPKVPVCVSSAHTNKVFLHLTPFFCLSLKRKHVRFVSLTYTIQFMETGLHSSNLINVSEERSSPSFILISNSSYNTTQAFIMGNLPRRVFVPVWYYAFFIHGRRCVIYLWPGHFLTCIYVWERRSCIYAALAVVVVVVDCLNSQLALLRESQSQIREHLCVYYIGKGGGDDDRVKACCKIKQCVCVSCSFGGGGGVEIVRMCESHFPREGGAESEVGAGAALAAASVLFVLSRFWFQFLVSDE